MTREDLKEYKYNQEWIKGRLEYIEEYRTSLTKITSVISDMPKRKSTGTRQYGREGSYIIRQCKRITIQDN